MTKMTITRETYNNSCVGIVELLIVAWCTCSQSQPGDHRVHWEIGRCTVKFTRLGALLPPVLNKSYLRLSERGNDYVNTSVRIYLRAKDRAPMAKNKRATRITQGVRPYHLNAP